MQFCTTRARIVGILLLSSGVGACAGNGGNAATKSGSTGAAVSRPIASAAPIKGESHAPAAAEPGGAAPLTTPTTPAAAGVAVKGVESVTQPEHRPTIYGQVSSPINDPFAGMAVSKLPMGNVSQVSFAQEGADFDPSISRDGSRIVFSSTQHRPTADLYVKLVDSRVVTQLTNDPGEDVMPSISPDGERIAFASNRSGNWDIFVMPVSGGKAVQITSDGAHDLHPSWSPEGDSLVFCRLGHGSGRWELWTTNVQNPAVSNFVGYGLFPHWCPVSGTGDQGGDRILFQLGRERGRRTFGLWTLEYLNGKATNMTELASSSTAALINPVWSPDGQRVVFASIVAGPSWTETSRARPDSAQLWMMHVDGTGRVNLTSDSTVAVMPTWGADNMLYFVCNRTGTDTIWRLDMSPALLAAGVPVEGADGAVADAPTEETGEHK